VYRAVDLSAPDEDAIVAVKVLRAVEDVEARRRFARELRLMEEVDHINVVPVWGSGEDDAGRPWYAMPLAQGSLADELPSLPGDDFTILDITRQVCAGLRYLHHELQILHRDLTPMNVLRTRGGAWAISDFGLAREAERRSSTLTTTHANLGTFLYQAPETMVDARMAGVAADVFSLGKLVDAMVRQAHPLPGSEPLEGPFRQVIAKATQFEPSTRYQSVDEFLGDMELAIEAPKGRWETTEESLGRLRALIRDEGSPSKATLRDLMAVAEAVPQDAWHELSETLPEVLTRDAIKILWREDPQTFRNVFSKYSRTIAESGYSFSYCDVLADFAERAWRTTDDREILRHAITGLAQLGVSHNRWHVRSTLVAILQGIRNTDTAMLALDTLRALPADVLDWNFENRDFVLRSLHPVLRHGLAKVLTSHEDDDNVHPFEVDGPF
jgi:serine/threonine protein kinase